MPQQASIEFSPLGRVGNVPIGETILNAAISAGVPVASSCEGNGICRACRVLVLQGQQFLSPPGDLETRASLELGFDPNERLACLARLLGPVRITTRYW